MTEVCIFTLYSDSQHFQKKLFQCINSRDISDVLHWNRCSLSECAWQWEENGKFDIPVDSLLLEDTSWWVSYDRFEDGW